ncbi:hypothetical protein OOK58_12470 [Streptomyces sp. NBC_01728]|uniref:hypothetical protein n=1 Tax=unclassified Streptomyces TaxID=2593676 RepID=UPI002253081F|nr:MULTISPECIES: hypothetical protein [unclassified Streptomyces]MCX4452897.1 hypothetical protein [Streptomyces sp. NBC_01719]MCX4492257.1 hypothetical protein [Streptomyces sp. NBC_01728]
MPTNAFDANEFLRDIHSNSAQFLVRSSARRVPTPAAHLSDGSYLAWIGYGVLPVLIEVRVIKAQVIVTLADGTVRREQWRLLTAGSGHGPDQLHLLLQTTADQVITASNSLPTGQADLTGAIGKAALDALLPAWRRPGSRPARGRTPPVSTDRTRENTPRSTRHTRSVPTSRSRSTDLRTVHGGRRNGVGGMLGQ